MFNLTEYRRRPGWLPDYLPWAGFVAQGVILNKAGSFTRICEYRGPDLNSATKAQLVAHSERVNDILRRFGTGWAYHIDADHRVAHGYPASEWSEKAAKLIDDERRADFEQEGAHYETDYRLSITYYPPTETSNKISSFMFEKDGRDDGPNYTAELENFVRLTDDFLNLFGEVMLFARWLGDDETLTFLHDCISTNRHAIKTPEVPFYFDTLLPDCELSVGPEPMLGKQHLRILSIRGFADKTTPALFDELNQIPMCFRWSVRWLAMDDDQAKSEIKSLRGKWYGKRKSMGVLMRDAITGSESKLDNPEAMGKVKQTDDALTKLGEHEYGYGHFTMNIVIMDENAGAADARIRALQKVIDTKGFVTKTETWNAVQAWLGTLPGHTVANVRRPSISTMNLAHMMPVSSVWAGPSWNAHLQGPPLLIAKTQGSTPFRLCTHDGELGHFLVLGPTRKGKSYLLAVMRRQFKRYARARNITLDKGGAARADTLAAGGKFYDLGDKNGAGFMPFAKADDEQERLWLREWVIGILKLADVTITSQIQDDIWNALNLIAEKPLRLRTFSTVRILCSTPEVKDALKPYTNEGPYGYLFDCAEDGLTGATDDVTFETQKIFEQISIMAPTIGYIFHWIRTALDGRPTFFCADEGWQYMAFSIVEDGIKDVLKAYAKANCFLGFSTQSVDDAHKSSIFAALIESCPSRILLPNEHAMEPGIKPLYDLIGCNEKQIQLIRKARGKQDYYFMSDMGNRLFQLGTGPMTRIICGSGSKEDHKLIDEIIERHGTDNFLDRFIAEKTRKPIALEAAE